MSKFNATIKSKPDTVNFAGGEAYSKSPKAQIVSILLTSFGKDSYYQSEKDVYSRFSDLYLALAPEERNFVAKAAIYARDKYGMRSITHFTAGMILEDMLVCKHMWAKSFFCKVISRPDDMAEILAYYWRNGKRPLPNALKKGFADAFTKFDDYQIAKYQMNDKAISLVDIINLVHPKPTERNSKALGQLIRGELKSTSVLSNLASKSKGKSKEEKAEVKKESWSEFLAKGDKIEMFALLRNLRNIVYTGDPQLRNKALELLVDKHRIRKSKIMPFRFLTAYDELHNDEFCKAAIVDALDLSLSNVPQFEGRTLVALDMSGSMFKCWWNANRKFDATSHFTRGSVFAAALYKAFNTDILMFNDRYLKCNRFLNKRDSVLRCAEILHEKAEGGGTSYSAIFDAIMGEAYDRIIIISDQESWVGDTKKALKEYRRHHSIDPKLYCLDVAGSSTLQFPESNCYCISGFSEEIFNTMARIEEDPSTVIKAIESIKL